MIKQFEKTGGQKNEMKKWKEKIKGKNENNFDELHKNRKFKNKKDNPQLVGIVEFKHEQGLKASLQKRIGAAYANNKKNTLNWHTNLYRQFLIKKMK